MINKKIIFRLLGILLVVESFFLLASFIVSIIYNDNGQNSLLFSFLFTFFLGLGALLFTRQANREIGKREAYIIVCFVWILFSLFGSLPFVLSGVIPNFTDAFFETMSGFTTTGISILNNIEDLPKSILFWRSLTQWMGGMSIIVLSLAILPFLGMGGIQLFSAEVPGLTIDKMHPKVKETLQRLGIIYIGFTLVEIILLWMGGMSFFDSINHSFTTMSTGGFSTKQAGIGFYDSAYIQYILILFMFIAGVNFTLPYFALKFQFEKVFSNEEFRAYASITFIFALIIGLGLYFTGNYSVELSFRESLFQVVSILTTTGFAITDYLLWPTILISLIFTLMFIGGSSGSTSGGVKVIRVLLIIKNYYYELKRLVHPKAVIPSRLNDKTIPQTLVNSVLVFFILYILIFVIGSVVMSALGLKMESAMGAVATTMGNIGPGLGLTSLSTNFSAVPQIGKWMLSFFMLLGRLELFTVLVLFAPSFWKK